MSDMATEASERAVADILAQFPAITEELIDPDGALVFARQEHVLPTGRRSDLLFFSGNELYLIELKIREARHEDVAQVESYIETYESEIIPAEYPGNELRPVLLAPSIPDAVNDECEHNGIEPVVYNVEDVLHQFNSKMFSQFEQHRLSIPSSGVRYLHYINGVVDYIASANNRSVSTDELVRNYDRVTKGDSSNKRNRITTLLRLARRFNLVEAATNALTERGEEFAAQIDEQNPWEITDQQAAVLLDLLHDQPYATAATYGIVTYLEAVFELSKNSHPVKRGDLIEWHAELLGNRERSQTQKKNVLVWTSNYAEELGLVRKFGRGAEEDHYLLPRAVPLLTSSRINSGLDMNKTFGAGRF